VNSTLLVGIILKQSVLTSWKTHRVCIAFNN